MLRVLARAGVVRPYPPMRLARVASRLHAWGVGPAGGFASMAVLHPDRPAVVDELGALTFAELDRRSDRLAHSLLARGVGPGDGVAVLCRNHRGLVDVSLAVAKLGADVVYLNTAFAGPQLAEVLARERPVLVVHDQEFAGLLAGADGVTRVVGWADEPEDGVPTVESLIRAGAPVSAPPAASPRAGRDPHLGHHRVPQEVPPAARRASRPPPRCSPVSRCEPAGAATSQHRSSTPGAGRTSRCPCCWARRSCFAAGSTRRAACAP